MVDKRMTENDSSPDTNKTISESSEGVFEKRGDNSIKQEIANEAREKLAMMKPRGN